MSTKEMRSEVGETKEWRMAVGLRSDASTVRTSRTHTSTHVRCRVTVEVPVCLRNAPQRDRDVNVTRTESVQHLHQRETHDAFVNGARCFTGSSDNAAG